MAPDTSLLTHPWLQRWALVADGAAQVRASGVVQAVRRANGQPAMLKIIADAQERLGAQLLQAWGGQGAAKVLALDGDALLMERLPGPSALALAQAGDAHGALRAVCECAAQLHAHTQLALPQALPTAADWLQALGPAAADNDVQAQCAQLAQQLLAQPDAQHVLHGDLHQANVLRDGAGQWRAIDPKGVVGERGFELAALLCNPEWPWASDQDLWAAAQQIAQASGLPHTRLLQWAAVRAGLSAAWFAEDGLAGSAAVQCKLAQTIISKLLQK